MKARKHRDRARSLAGWLTLAVLTCALTPSVAAAFTLGVYGRGGYDMVASKPPEGADATLASPEPSGPSYGLGVTSELARFSKMVSLGASAGFGGLSASWKAEKAGLSPSAVSLSTMGLELGGRLAVHFGSFRAFGYGDFLYGLFGNEYSNTTDGTTQNPAGKVTTFKVDSAMRFGAGLGAGYEIGAFAIDLLGGFTSVGLTVVTPADAAEPNKAVKDTFNGFTIGAMASYRFLGDEPSGADRRSKDELRPSKTEGKTAPAKKKSKKKRKSRKKPPATP